MDLIIHHWDTDGICAAAMLLNEKSVNMTPKIGNYFLEDDELAWIEKMQFEKIYVVDMALHEGSLKKLSEMAPVKVFDHHITRKVEGITYLNPIIEGADEEDYPSASWVVGMELGMQDDIRAYLGAMGDWEERIKTLRFYEILRRFMEKDGISFEAMHEMTALIDSNYKIGDKKAVEKAVHDISQAEDVAAFIRNNTQWRKNREIIEKEIERALNAPEEMKGNVLIKHMNCVYNIISTVARRLWDGTHYVIVKNCGYFPDSCQLYVRGSNCLPLIDMARKRGYVAGGKKHVMGAIVPKEEVDEMIQEVVAKIGGE